MKDIRKLVISGACLAIGLVLPFITGQIPEIGKALSPMHIPVMICGFICGPLYGIVIGFICPLLRSVLFQMPKMVPDAMVMACELAAYGAFTGIFYRLLPRKKFNIYISLVGAMLMGRVVYGFVAYMIYHAIGQPFTWEIYMAKAFTSAVPGIVCHILLVPVIVMALQKAGLMEYKNK